MSPLLLKGLIGVGTAGIVGTSGWGIFKFLEPRTIGGRILSEGHTFPPFEGEDLSEWKKLAKKYKENTSETSLKFSSLSTLSDENSDEEVKKLRDECGKIFNKEVGQEDYDTDANRLRKWCVISPGGGQ